MCTITTKGDRTRPSSESLSDSNRENSCFLLGIPTVADLSTLFPEAPAFARIPSQVLRQNGFGIERRPNECPAAYIGNPDDHVVVGPVEDVSKREYIRRAERIVRDPAVEIVYRQAARSERRVGQGLRPVMSARMTPK